MERMKYGKASLRIVSIYVNGDMEKKLEELKEWMEEREKGENNNWSGFQG